MPLIKNSSYPDPPFYRRNAHLQTILPAIVRKVKGIKYERERITTADDDFLDLDWLRKDSDNLLILTHGLEGSSERHYMMGMADFFYKKGWEVLAWNCRSCSGEMNCNLRLYNHGEIEDIEAIVQHALAQKTYKNVALVGFSMGGSITMKYLGARAGDIPEAVRAGVAFSSPCDLKDSIRALEDGSNWFYRRRFYNSLQAKIRAKAVQFPDQIDVSHFENIKAWVDFDNHYSAPLNGYQDAEDFYEQASAKNFIPAIQTPTLLVNAQNDPILTPACSPVEIAKNHPYFYLEMPTYGGHVGFHWKNSSHAWSEHRAWEFVQQWTR